VDGFLEILERPLLCAAARGDIQVGGVGHVCSGRLPNHARSNPFTWRITSKAPATYSTSVLPRAQPQSASRFMVRRRPGLAHLVQVRHEAQYRRTAPFGPYLPIVCALLRHVLQSLVGYG
jgi:hypothetical protein